MTQLVVSSDEFTTVSTDQPSGGWWYTYDQELGRRKRAKAEREAAEKRAEQIQDKIEREIALELRKHEAEQAKIKELERLSRLAERYRDELQVVASDRVVKAADRAARQGNYSALEALDREIRQFREEEEFLMQALAMVING